MRTIFAMGGGGFTMEPDNTVLDEYILGLARRPVPRVCFLPTASGDPLDHITRFYEAFSDMPCEPTDLSLFRLGRRAVDLRTLPQAQDMVYVGAGSMRNMLAMWRGRRPRAAPRLALRALRRRAGAPAGVPRGRGVGCGPRGLRSRRWCRPVVPRRPARARRLLAPRGRLRTREARRRPGRRGGGAGRADRRARAARRRGPRRARVPREPLSIATRRSMRCRRSASR